MEKYHFQQCHCESNSAGFEIEMETLLTFSAFLLQKMTAWMMKSGSFDEADEDEAAASDVAEEIKAVDLELQQLQFEIQMEQKKTKAEAKAQVEVPPAPQPPTTSSVQR